MIGKKFLKKFLDPERRGENMCPRLYVVRDVEVMLDSDLARLFQTTTKRLNQAVKRHLDRFPKEFMFKVTEIEFEILRSQIVTSKSGGAYHTRAWFERRGGRRNQPFVFTSLGVEMLATILKWDLED